MKKALYLVRDVSRHGVARYYVRRPDLTKKIRIDGEGAPYNSAEFWLNYHTAMGDAYQELADRNNREAKSETLRWLIEKYRLSGQYADYKQSTRTKNDRVYRAIVELAGDEPLDNITTTTIRNSVDKRRATPAEANNFLKALRNLFAWATKYKVYDKNPTKDVEYFKPTGEGHKAWSEEDISKFEAKWQLGTMERLAIDLLIYTGLRRGDVVRLGWHHLNDGMFSIRMEKMEGRTNEEAYIVLLEPLRVSIEKTRQSLPHLYTNNYGSFLRHQSNGQFLPESFGNWFRDICNAAGITGKSAHGLRKAAAIRCAENGGTESMLKSIFGWSSSQMANFYTQKANRKKIAKEGSKHLLKR